jgi:phosphotransferase system HPr (HPr) family protein
MQTLNIVIAHRSGLHARPVARFFQTAIKFHSKITVRNPKNSKSVDGKSVVKLLTLGVEKGEEIVITTDGVDEVAALAALKDLIETNFGEEE